MLWPKETHRYTESLADQKLYDALKSGLPDGWQAWHSLRLRSRESGQFGEADVVIADPSQGFWSAIIITDLRLVKKHHHMRMHIAVSRALSLLRIVGVEAEIRKDSILKNLV